MTALQHPRRQEKAAARDRRFSSHNSMDLRTNSSEMIHLAGAIRPPPSCAAGYERQVLTEVIGEYE